jgi:HK97 family phage major capsid protein
MSEFLNSQVEARNNLIMQMRDVIDSAEVRGGLDSEDNQKIARIEADIESRDAAIATAKRLEQREAEATEAMASFVSPVAEARSSNDEDVFRSLAMGEQRSHDFERRTLTSTSGTGVVGTSFYNQVLEVAQSVAPLLNFARVINTTGGDNLQVPVLSALSTGAIAPQGSAISSSDPTITNITLGAFKYGVLVPISKELVADAQIDINSLVAREAGKAIGYAAGGHFTTGTGTTQPFGIVTGAGSAVTSGTAGLSADDLITLLYSLDPEVRNDASFAYMVSPGALAAIRKLKDTAGNYIWNVANGQNQILGYNVVENVSMPAHTTGNKSIIAGRMSDFVIRQAGGIKVEVSDDYGFANDLRYFKVTARFDSKLALDSSVKFIKVA